MKINSVTLLYILLLSGILVLIVILLLYFGHTLIEALSFRDNHLFFRINHLHSPFWDGVMYAASDKVFWFPFYIFLIYILFRSFGKQCWQPLLLITLLTIASDQISAHLIKNWVMRLRPSHEVALVPFIHLSKAGPGGLYGFISSHAANTTSLTVFLVLLLNKRLLPLKIILISWALLVSYSRIYNGVHYPSDVLVAIVIGLLLGLLFYLIHQFIFSKALNHAG